MQVVEIYQYTTSFPLCTAVEGVQFGRLWTVRSCVCRRPARSTLAFFLNLLSLLQTLQLTFYYARRGYVLPPCPRVETA